MTNRIENARELNDDNAAELYELRRLVAAAPSSTFSRFRRRARVVQGTRVLFESQIYGFWTVLDIVLKRLFRITKAEPTNASESSMNINLGDRA